MPRIFDIPILLFLAFIWASAFAAIKVAVPVVGPEFLVLCRCAIGAGALLLVIGLMHSRHKTAWPQGGRNWFWLGLTGVVSTALPFWLISFAEQKISSSMTGMLMTAIPLVAIVLGHFWTDDEKINRGKALGVGVGFVGTIILLGEGVEGLGEGEIIYPLAVVLAASCYALGGFMAKKMPLVSAEVIAAGVLLASTVAVVPLVFLAPPPIAVMAIPLETWGALLWLGVMTSAFAFYLRYFLIKRAGYGFVSYVGYLIPIFAIIIGNLWLNEPVLPETLVIMAVILAGLFLTRGAGDFPWNLTPKLKAIRRRLN